MKIVSLDQNWTFRQVNALDDLPAKVPGVVHLDLMAHDKIADPFFRDNEKEQYWIGETDWHYRCTFEVSAEDLEHSGIRLVFHGLDTLATVTLNGVSIGTTDNMYRVWAFDVKAALKAGENVLDVIFAAPMPYVRAMEAEKGVLPSWAVGGHRLNAGTYIRKQPSNFGWDWGPQFVTSGIWRPVELQMFDTARLAGVLVTQDHSTPDQVRLTITPDIKFVGDTASVLVEVALTRNDRLVASSRSRPDEMTPLVVTDPELWYPNGLGEQPLYHLSVRLFDAEGKRLDRWERRIGLRELKLVRKPDAWGESFYFEVNGRPFFAKGANWIPADPFVARLSRADYEPLIADAAAVHMNMLRVWGGGIYEHDSFYDLCDEYGICIWQDFMFSCGTYPSYDAEFMENVRAEAVDNVRRLRHHPSLALWCGNNELEQGLVGHEWTATTMSLADYSKLFDVLLKDVVQQEHPQGNYWPASPHSPLGDRLDWQNPTCGDVHLWGVWHGLKPFEWYYESTHRFVSEFGLQSFPQPNTLYPVLDEGDHDILGPVMTYRQRSEVGNNAIASYMADWFKPVGSFEARLWVSQILQGIAMKTGIEHWRRQMPRTMGTLYWQLNDMWQAPSWSSIEYGGNWKALHYMARHFYAPALVSGVWHPESRTFDLQVTNDHRREINGRVVWKWIDTAGAVRHSGQIAVRVAQNTSQPVTTIPITPSEFDPEDGLLWAELWEGETLLSQNTVLASRPKVMRLQNPNISVKLEWKRSQTAQITVYTKTLALWVWLSHDRFNAAYSDNFFHLSPDEPRVITVSVPDGIQDAFASGLRARSLFDLT
ncbi:MAG: glycoside hydrolase family 2 protein [Chloroflexi bacterium]|nr:glycoside hydrolase family 2 protein [Chloroflexota bacterium]